MDLPCERFVPGYGDTRAHFHVVGDHPGVHGGLDAGVPDSDIAAVDGGGVYLFVDAEPARQSVPETGPTTGPTSLSEPRQVR